MKINPNAPAYPLYAPAESYSYHSGSNAGGGASFSRILQPGLTIRAELAARFMAASISYDGWTTKEFEDIFATNAIRHADALIAALNKDTP